MGSISHGRRIDDRGLDRPRTRLTRFLAARCPTPKALACKIKCSPKTAENILAEHWPNDLTLANIVRCFGRDVWDAVFLPDLDPVEARITANIQDLETQLADQRARLRAVAGTAETGERRSSGVATPMARVSSGARAPTLTGRAR